MKILLKSTLAIGIYFLVSSQAFSDVIYDNLTNSIAGGGEHIGDGSPGGIADSFSTGASVGALTDVQLVLSDSNPADGDTINVALYSDNNTALGSPIIQIGSISDSSLNSNFATYDFVLTTPEALSSNTRYWVDVSDAYSNTAEWAWTMNISGIGVANENFWDYGTAQNKYGPFMMSVGASSPVPVPSAAWLFTSVLAGFGIFRRSKDV